MDILRDTGDQVLNSYLHLFYRVLKSLFSYVYFIKSSTPHNGKSLDKFHTPRPLINIGLNCYLNSSFQSIVACPRFVNEMKLLENTYPTAKNLFAFNNILSVLSKNSKESLKLPSNEILRNWNKAGEQDTFELLSHIIFQVFNELKHIKQKQVSDMGIPVNIVMEDLLPMMISMIFKMQCPFGHSSTPKIQTDLAIHLPIPFRVTLEKISMEKLLDNYFIEEEIADSKCISQICDAHVNKFVTLQRPLPSTLCIHLQRSFWNSNTGKMQKNNEKVKFFEKLIIKASYFNPIRNTKCDNGLLFKTISSLVDDINFCDRKDDSDDIIKDEILIEEKKKVELRDEGDVIEGKVSCLSDKNRESLPNIHKDLVVTKTVKCNDKENDLETKDDNHTFKIVSTDNHEDHISLSERTVDAIITFPFNDEISKNELALDEGDVIDGKKPCLSNEGVENLLYVQNNVEVTSTIKCNGIETGFGNDDANQVYNNVSTSNDEDPLILSAKKEDAPVFQFNELNNEIIENEIKHTEVTENEVDSDKLNKLNVITNHSVKDKGGVQDSNLDEKDINCLDEEYFLKSVIVHFGNPESGHYICYRKCGERWFCTNDSFINEVSIRDVLNSEAYILMYEKDI